MSSIYPTSGTTMLGEKARFGELQSEGGWAGDILGAGGWRTVISTICRADLIAALAPELSDEGRAILDALPSIYIARRYRRHLL